MLLASMIEMATSVSGMVTDFMEGDFTHADAGYGDFRVRYEKLSQMVPEWAADFPREPVDALDAPLRSRDPATLMPAVEQATRACHACHVKRMTRVQQKYHWGDFRDMVLTDPVSKGDVRFTALMQMLDGDLSGIQVDLGQGQVEEARAHASALAARYGTLKDACGACHDSERSYYVDSRITGMLDGLRAALAGAEADGGSVRKLALGIGTESCHKCHLVHGPAALARYASETGKP
jgi:hypothetical protein